MFLFLKSIIATFYLVRVLIFEEKTSHFGPFPSDKQFVRIAQTGYTQPVTLFDRIRRYTMNPYKVGYNGEIWEVDQQKMERWTCPTCLSAWVALFVVIVIALFVQRPRTLKDLFELMLFGAGVAGGSALLNSVAEKGQDNVMLWQGEKDA